MSPVLAAVLVIGAAGLLMLIVAHWLEQRAAPPRDLDERARADVMAALDHDGLVTSVRIYRERTGSGLLDAYEAVRRIARDRR